MIRIPRIPPGNLFRVIPTFTHSDSLQCILVATVINQESSNTTCSILIFQLKLSREQNIIESIFLVQQRNLFDHVIDSRKK